MQRKPGPHGRDILVQLRQLETIPRHQVLVEARQEIELLRSEFAEMFGPSQLDSRLLIHRARRALKHAMGVKQ